MLLAGILGGLGIFMILMFIGFVILIPLIALIDIIRNDFDGNNKLLWVLIVLFLPFIGSVIYFIIGRSQRRSRY